MTQLACGAVEVLVSVNDFVGQDSESSTPKSRDGDKKIKRVATVVML